MKLNQKLAVTSAGVALGFTALYPKPTQAATVTVDFTVTGTSGSILNQQFSGFYSYDDSTIPSDVVSPGGEPRYSLTDFNFNFGYLGTNYTLADFSQGAGYGGTATGLLGFATILAPTEEVLAGYGGIIGSGLAVKSQVGFLDENFFFDYNQFGQESSGQGTIAYSVNNSSTSVPEPSALSGLGVAGLSFILLKKKAASKQRA